ncbi:MAG: Lhr family helicase, partial [Actinomycetota bacterium]
LAIYRRMEARGEIRGGRFVNGFVGEQFALPEAVEALRAVRRSGDDEQTLILHAPDPLNLVGIIVPGARVSPFSTLAVAYRNGAAVDAGPLGALRSRLYGRQAAGAGMGPVGAGPVGVGPAGVGPRIRPVGLGPSGDA